MKYFFVQVTKKFFFTEKEGCNIIFHEFEPGRIAVRRSNGAPMIFLPTGIITYLNVFYRSQFSAGMLNRNDERYFATCVANMSAVAERLLHKILVHVDNDIFRFSELTEKDNGWKIA